MNNISPFLKLSQSVVEKTFTLLLRIDAIRATDEMVKINPDTIGTNIMVLCLEIFLIN